MEGHAIVLLRVVDVIQFSRVLVRFAFESTKELRGVDGIRRVRIDTPPGIQPFYSFIFFQFEVDERSVTSSPEVVVARGQEVGPTHGHL